MRLSEKEITDHCKIEEIIKQGKICRIGLFSTDFPYIVPMHYGYKNNNLFFHCAKEGRKIDLIKNNPNVCFEIEAFCEIINTDIPCEWSTKYASVIGTGKASIIDNIEDKKSALDIIVNHYAKSDCDFSNKMLENVTIIKIEINKMTGKRSEE